MFGAFSNHPDVRRLRQTLIFILLWFGVCLFIRIAVVVSFIIRPIVAVVVVATLYVGVVFRFGFHHLTQEEMRVVPGEVMEEDRYLELTLHTKVAHLVSGATEAASVVAV